MRPVVPPPPSGNGVISGRVTASDGTPIARARVIISADELYAIDREQKVVARRITTTGKDGQFVIGELPASSTLVVSVTKTGFAPHAFGQTVAGMAPPPLTLAADEKRLNTDVQLVPEVTISGHILDVDHTPLAGMLVEALHASPDGGPPTVVTDTLSDDVGAYTISSLEKGQYYVRASDPVLTNPTDSKAPAPVLKTFYPSTTDVASARTVSAASAGQHLTDIDIPLQLPPAPTVGATPSASPTISGRINSFEDNTPIKRARVIVTAGDVPGAPSITVLTDDAGQYVATGLPATKSLVVTAEKTGFAARAFGELPPISPPQFVDLPASGKRADVNVKLFQQIPIRGRINDEDGTPFSGAVVQALRASYTNGGRDLNIVAETLSGPDGSYRLFGLPPGQYYLSAFDPSYTDVGDAGGILYYGPTYYPGKTFPDDASRIAIDTSTTVQGIDFSLKIVRPARVRGTISTSDGRQLRSGEVIMSQLRADESASYSVSNVEIRSDNTFLFANVLPGRYMIWARGETQQNGRQYFHNYSLSVDGNDNSGVSLSMLPGVVLNGVLKYEVHGHETPTGLAAAEIQVRAPLGNGATFGDALTGKVNADGAFAILGVSAGEHLIRVEGLPAPWRLQAVTLAGRDITDLPVDFASLGPTDGLRITVTDEATAIFGTLSVDNNDTLPTYCVIAFTADLSVWRPNSRKVQLVHPGEDGHYRIEGLPPGEYYVAASRDIDEGDIGNPKALEKLRVGAKIVRLKFGTDHENQDLIGR